jgi:hypothetical protein
MAIPTYHNSGRNYGTGFDMMKRIDALEADNARLREALDIYADPCDATETTPCGYTGNQCCKAARAAITPKPPTATT